MEAPCTGESPPLHVKNPLHYSYNGVMVHLHTPIRPRIRHLQESSVLKEADYLEKEEEYWLTIPTIQHTQDTPNLISRLSNEKVTFKQTAQTHLQFPNSSKTKRRHRKAKEETTYMYDTAHIHFEFPWHSKTKIPIHRYLPIQSKPGQANITFNFHDRHPVNWNHKPPCPKHTVRLKWKKSWLPTFPKRLIISEPAQERKWTSWNWYQANMRWT